LRIFTAKPKTILQKSVLPQFRTLKLSASEQWFPAKIKSTPVFAGVQSFQYGSVTV